MIIIIIIIITAGREHVCAPSEQLWKFSCVCVYIYIYIHMCIYIYIYTYVSPLARPSPTMSIHTMRTRGSRESMTRGPLPFNANSP